MKIEFQKNINSLFEIILTIEKKEQEKYYNAVKSDTIIAKKLMAEANKRINKLRDVIDIIKNIHIETLNVFDEDEIQEKTITNDEKIIKMCEELILAKPYGFLSINSEYVSINPDNLKEPLKQLTNSMYVSTAGSADVICKEILSKCGIKEQEYNLYYKEA